MSLDIWRLSYKTLKCSEVLSHVSVGYLDEGVGRHLPLAGDHHGQVHHHKLIAGIELRGAPVGDVRGGVGRVVHIGHVTVRGELYQLGARAEITNNDASLTTDNGSNNNNCSPDSLLWLQTRGDDAELHQRRPVSASPVAEEHLRGAEAAVVEVSWEAAR